MSKHKATDIRIEGVRVAFESFAYRAPMKFGGRVVTAMTLLSVGCDVSTRDGARRATGLASMPLGNTWAFPSAVLSNEQTLAAMKRLAERCAEAARALTDYGHPIELGLALEERFLQAAKEVALELTLAEPIPKLATLVTGSSFDAALHDAFGKAHGLNVYSTYTREFLPENRNLDGFIRRDAVPSLPLYHLVGALDPLSPADVTQPIGDGLPEALPDWIARDGLTHFKVKLNGDDLAWDLERVLGVDRVVNGAVPPANEVRYSLDFNERCQSVAYLIELLHKVRELAPVAFERVQYVEQPTARDLAAHPENRMHAAAKLRPVVIDESLTDLDSLLLAREMGYTGAALKACKGQSQSLLLAAAAQEMGMFLCVQDLTCPGASLLHSASLAAHVPGVAGIEANARQYVPAANRGWEERYPGIFCPREGRLQTGELTGIGLWEGAHGSHAL